jgi:phosphomannomutase
MAIFFFYIGYKVYWSTGCQIIPPHDTGIAKEIAANQVPWVWDSDTVVSLAEGQGSQPRKRQRVDDGSDAVAADAEADESLVDPDVTDRVERAYFESLARVV